MIQILLKFIKNDVVFWIFFAILTTGMILFVLKKEGIQITITFSEPYNNRVVEIFGD